jgi:hypothetical protein
MNPTRRFVVSVLKYPDEQAQASAGGALAIIEPQDPRQD